MSDAKLTDAISQSAIVSPGIGLDVQDPGGDAVGSTMENLAEFKLPVQDERLPVGRHGRLHVIGSYLTHGGRLGIQAMVMLFLGHAYHVALCSHSAVQSHSEQPTFLVLRHRRQAPHRSERSVTTASVAFSLVTDPGHHSPPAVSLGSQKQRRRRNQNGLL